MRGVAARPRRAREVPMTRPFGRPVAALALVLLVGLGARAGRAAECVSGPLPQNSDNKLRLCSPDSSELQLALRPDGIHITWAAPPRGTSTYVGPVTARHWANLDSLAVVPGVTVTGTYLAYRDRRIELVVQSIDSLGTSLRQGVVGQHTVTLVWFSPYDEPISCVAGDLRPVGGEMVLPESYAGEGLRLDFPKCPANPPLPPDTTRVAGLRIHVARGTRVAVGDVATFDVEDFEGWHVWRWRADPTRLDYEAVGELSKLAATAAPWYSWSYTADYRQVSFVDRNVFDGFLYHYAITTYDQGFRRDTGGADMAFKIDSPVAPAQRDPQNPRNIRLAPTQVRVSYRKPPPAEFFPIAAVPNPYRESTADRNRPETQVVQFINAPTHGVLYVFTLAGDLVLEREHGPTTAGTIEWDTRNRAGEKVASGVYIYKIVDLDSGRESFGRLAVIR
jgi:hypothetical protein